MNDSWAGPRVRTALDQLATDRQQLVREYYALAASFEDGAAGRSRGSWLAAKRYEHFASYLADYDSRKMLFSLEELTWFSRDRLAARRRRDWRRWRRLLGRR